MAADEERDLAAATAVEVRPLGGPSDMTWTWVLVELR